MTAEQVSLSPHAQEFVASIVQSGEVSDAAEVVDIALRRLEQERASKLATLKSEVQKGFDDIEQGRYTDLHGEDELKAHLAKLREERTAERSARA